VLAVTECITKRARSSSGGSICEKERPRRAHISIEHVQTDILKFPNLLRKREILKPIRQVIKKATENTIPLRPFAFKIPAFKSVCSIKDDSMYVVRAR
jgi:hypothetical protein